MSDTNPNEPKAPQPSMEELDAFFSRISRRDKDIVTWFVNARTEVLAAKVQEQAAQIERLRVLLLEACQNGNHDSDCAFRNSGLLDCDCWIAAARAALEEEK